MFKDIKKAMQLLFAEMVIGQNNLFITDLEKDKLWETYLDSYIDPIVKQEHNCSACRSFIKNYGNIVAIRGNDILTLWDFIAPEEFTETVKAMKKLVLSSTIRDIFITNLPFAGTDKNRQTFDKEGKLMAIPLIWEHFYLTLPKFCVNKNSSSVEAIMGTARDNKNVFKRSLDEITLDAIQTVLELISQNSLYRGEEFKGVVTEFLKHKKEYDKAGNKDNYCWIKAQNNATVSRIRNTSIGTLLTDISEGKELDVAVAAFERMVAPMNYKRPTAVVTKRMVEEAEKTINELGYTESLNRRFATADDILVTNLLFVNRDKKKTGAFEELKNDVIVNPKSLNKVEEITIDKFIKDVLPNIESMEVLFENSHLSNLVSIIAPKDKEAPSMFKWSNPFSWSYTNAVTDSIKEQVKAAGGKVEGELRVSLSWFNYDDLDLHVIEPNGHRIYFRDKMNPVTGGHLDVDMNAGSGTTRKAVENIIWLDKKRMLEGTYKVEVNNFNKRENVDTGFVVEVEQNGEVYTFEHAKAVRDKETIKIAEFTYTKKGGVVFTNTGKTSVLSKDKWGISTNKFHKVNMLMLSPNHWEGTIGNKHLFFIIEGAVNDEIPRGFFNEFLKEELVKNKRVFEVLGGKLKVETDGKQLSGLGFSSTQRSSLICKLEGKFSRFIKINF